MVLFSYNWSLRGYKRKVAKSKGKKPKAKIVKAVITKNLEKAVK
jgi:hypothetical protein